MALRRFLDAQGRDWQVWDTHPGRRADSDDSESALHRFMSRQPKVEGAQPTGVRPQFKAGWLTFMADGDRRRLTPVPDQWESADDSQLRDYLERAEKTEPPTTPRPTRKL